MGVSTRFAGRQGRSPRFALGTICVLLTLVVSARGQEPRGAVSDRGLFPPIPFGNVPAEPPRLSEADEALLRGDGLLRAGHLDTALAEFNRAVSLQPRNAQGYFGRGMVYSKKNQLDRAFAELHRSIALDPQHALSYVWRSNVYRRLNNYEAALADSNRAVELSPYDFMCFKERGQLYEEMKDYEHANADYTEAIKVNSGDASLYGFRARTYRQFGDHARAIADINRAIELNPEEGLWYEARGVFFAEQKAYHRAIVDYSQALLRRPDQAYLYYYRARSYQYLGDHPHAILDLDKALAFAPGTALYYYYRGNSQGRTGANEKAFADYGQAIQLDPRFHWTYYRRGLLRNDTGDFAGAIADFDVALRINPDDSQLLLARACTLIKQHEDIRALADLDRLQETKADLPFVPLLRSVVFESQGKPEDARAERERAIAISPEFALCALVGEAIDAMRGCDWHQALNVCDELERGFPQAIEPDYVRGMVRLDQGNQNSALALFDRVLARQPSFVPAILERGKLHYLRGALDSATVDFDQVVRLKPDEPFGYFGLGLSHFAQGKFARSIDDYSKAIPFLIRDAELRRTSIPLSAGGVSDRQLHFKVLPDEEQNGLESGNRIARQHKYSVELSEVFVRRGLAYLGTKSLDAACADFGRAFMHLRPVAQTSTVRGLAALGQGRTIAAAVILANVLGQPDRQD